MWIIIGAIIGICFFATLILLNRRYSKCEILWINSSLKFNKKVVFKYKKIRHNKSGVMVVEPFNCIFEDTDIQTVVRCYKMAITKLWNSYNESPTNCPSNTERYMKEWLDENVTYKRR